MLVGLTEREKFGNLARKIDGKKREMTSDRIEILEAESTSKVLSLLVEISELKAQIIKLNSRNSSDDFGR